MFIVDYNKYKRLKANREKVKNRQKKNKIELNKFLEKESDIYTDKNLKVKY